MIGGTTLGTKSRQYKLDRTPDKDEIGSLPPRPLTPEQEEKVKDGLTSSEGNLDGITSN